MLIAINVYFLLINKDCVLQKYTLQQCILYKQIALLINFSVLFLYFVTSSKVFLAFQRLSFHSQNKNKVL